MAPLLGRKPYPLAKPLTEPPGPGEESYTIEHTGEAFRNKEYPSSPDMLSTYPGYTIVKRNVIIVVFVDSSCTYKIEIIAGVG